MPGKSKRCWIGIGLNLRLAIPRVIAKPMKMISSDGGAAPRKGMDF
jgi:hypothetical protein